MECRNCTKTLFPLKAKLLLLGFIAILILLIVNVLGNIKDLNDEWILTGSLQVYFIIFVFAYCVVVGLSSSLKFVAILTSIFFIVVNLIPNLKYVFIYGYHDPIGHYGFIQEMIRSGNVPNTGVYSNYYGPTPGLHIFVSSISQISGLDVLTSMKIFLVTFPLILPLAVYFVARRLSIPNNLAKMMIVSTAITAPKTYVFSGPTASYYLYVLFIYIFLLLFSIDKTREQFIVVILLGFTIVVSHSVTSFFLSLCVFVVFLYSKLRTVEGPYKARVHAFPALVIVVISLAYFIFVARLNFSTIMLQMRSFAANLFSTKPPVAFGYYETFFQIGLLDQIRVLTVRVSKDAVSIFLIVLAPWAISSLKLKNSPVRRFYKAFTIPLLLALSLFFATLFLFPFSIRGLYYLAPYSPFLAGACLFYLTRKVRRRFKWILETLAVFSLICVSLLQVYSFQPIVPKISTSYGQYYVLNMGQVNTIYDRSVISFIDTYDSSLHISTDYTTWWQVQGLTDPSVQELLTKTSPLLTENMTTQFLIIVHGDPIAHTVPSAKDAEANQLYIRSAFQVESVLYTNGKSYVLLNMPFKSNRD